MDIMNPFFAADSHNDEIEVARGTVLVNVDDASEALELEGQAAYSFSPEPGIVLRGQGAPASAEPLWALLAHDANRRYCVRLRLPDGTRTEHAKCFIGRKISFRGNQEASVTCTPETGCLSHKPDIAVDTAFFPVVNGPTFQKGEPIAFVNQHSIHMPPPSSIKDERASGFILKTADCLHLSWSGWEVKIVATRSSARHGGSGDDGDRPYRITHCGEIKRGDGAGFTLRDLDEENLLVSLRLFLSFLKGQHVGVPIIKAPGAGGAFRLTRHRISTATSRTGFGWFDGTKVAKEELRSMFVEFCHKIKREPGHFLVRIQMYMDAVASSAAVDSRALVAHGALELADAGRSEGPSAMLANAVTSAGFDNLGVPECWAEGLAYDGDLRPTAGYSGKSLSERLRHLRNQLTHMDFYSEHANKWEKNVQITVWCCYVQLVELGILQELKFEGAYNVREVNSPHSSQVPWAAK